MAATITKGPTNDLTSVFDTVLFLCESTGIPIPDISWSQREEGGSLVTLDNKTQLQTGTPIRFQTNFNYVTNVTVKRLYLMSVDVSDAGEYVCLTSNGVESQSPRIMQTASAFLNVSTSKDNMLNKLYSYKHIYTYCWHRLCNIRSFS